MLEFRRVLRSEEHTSELQSHDNLVCRLLLEKKTIQSKTTSNPAREWQKPTGPALRRATAWGSGRTRACLRSRGVGRGSPAAYFVFYGSGPPGVHPLSPPGPFPI